MTTTTPTLIELARIYRPNQREALGTISLATPRVMKIHRGIGYYPVMLDGKLIGAVQSIGPGAWFALDNNGDRIGPAKNTRRAAVHVVATADVGISVYRAAVRDGRLGAAARAAQVADDDAREIQALAVHTVAPPEARTSNEVYAAQMRAYTVGTVDGRPNGITPAPETLGAVALGAEPDDVCVSCGHQACNHDLPGARCNAGEPCSCSIFDPPGGGSYPHRRAGTRRGGALTDERARQHAVAVTEAGSGVACEHCGHVHENVERERDCAAEHDPAADALATVTDLTCALQDAADALKRIDRDGCIDLDVADEQRCCDPRVRMHRDEWCMPCVARDALDKIDAHLQP